MAEAQGFGNCNFGSYTFGSCVLPSQQPSGSGGGGSSESSKFSVEEYLNLFSQFTLDLFKKWFFSGELPVLEYKINAPDYALQGSSVIVNNLFTNEVDNLSVELHCINFIDLNKNGNMDLKDSFASFNKKAEPRILNNATTTLLVPEMQEIGDYLIAGQCELGSGSPNATSSRKIKILPKGETEPIIKDLRGISFKNKWLWAIAVIIAIALLWVIKELIINLFLGTGKLFISMFSMGFIGWIVLLIIGGMIWFFIKRFWG